MQPACGLHEAVHFLFYPRAGTGVKTTEIPIWCTRNSMVTLSVFLRTSLHLGAIGLSVIWFKHIYFINRYIHIQ